MGQGVVHLVRMEPFNPNSHFCHRGLQAPIFGDEMLSSIIGMNVNEYVDTILYHQNHWRLIA